MKPKSKKHQQSPPPSTEEQRVPTSALSYIKHRLFHSSRSSTHSFDHEPDRTVNEPLTTTPLVTTAQPKAVDIPSSTISPSDYLASDRPFSKSLENDLQMGRPVFRRTTSDLHTPQVIKKDTHAANRTSQIIWKEGYLFKKTDFRPFHSHKTNRGWKLYRVVLRGHKLYLYRTTIQHQDSLKSLLALNTSSSTSTSSTNSSSQLLSSPPSRSPSFTTTTMVTPPAIIKEKNSVTLDPSEFDDETKKQLFTTPPLDLVYAAVFTEWDRQRKKTATAVYLLIYSDRLVVCKKRKQVSGIYPLWHAQSSTPLQQLVLSPCKSSSSFVSPPPSSASSSTPIYSGNPSLSVKENAKNDGSSQHSISYFSGHSTSSVSSPTVSSTPSTLVNRFTLSYESQPWKQTTYVSLSKELVSSWMESFYESQRICGDGKNDVAKNPSDHNNDGASTDDIKYQINAEDMETKPLSVDTSATRNSGRGELLPHTGLMLNGQDDRSVLGGTIPALVHELLFETQQQGKEFTYAFLLTYNMFTTISEVLDLMKGYLDCLQDTPQTVSLWNRLLDLYRIWCIRFAYDVVGDLVTGMMERLDALEENDTLPSDLRSRGEEIRALILQTVQDNQHIIEHAQTQRNYSEGVEVVDVIQRYSGGGNDNDSKSIETVSSPMTPASLSPPVVDLSDLVATGLSPALFLSMDPDRLAEQIYIFHHTQHYLHRYQLLSALSYVSRPQVPPQMLNTLLFTSPSPHFLTRLIWQHVLVETRLQQTDNAMVMRTSLLEHWIRVGAALMELKDMTGWSAVAMGVCSMEIARLKEAWKTVDRSLIKMVMHVWGPLLADHGIYSLDVWMEGWEHETRLQDMFSQILDVDSLDLPAQVYSNRKSSLRSLPHFGSLKQSVDRLRRHVPLYLSCTSKDVINFMSSWCVHDTIRSGLGTWKKGRHLTWDDEDDTKGSLPFQVVRPLQMYFDSTVNQVSSVPHDFKYLHECSLVCEPRIFGQALVDRPSKEVAGPSYSPLAFPDTLDAVYTFFPKLASEKLFGQASQKHNSQQQQQQSSGHEVQLVHRQEQYSYLTQASLYALQKVDTMGYLDTKRDSITTLPDDDVSRWMEDSSFTAQHQQVMAVKQQLDYTRQHRKQNETLFGNNNGWIFHLGDNTLVLVAEGLLPVSPPSTSSLPLGQENGATSIINVRAGYLVPLVDLLIHGVGQFKTTMLQQWRALGPSASSLTGNDKLDLNHLVMDDEEYMRVFFTTYRMFCSPKRLMMILQDQFTQAKSQGSQARRLQQEQSKKQRRRMTMMDTGFVSTGLAKLETTETAVMENGTDVLAFDWLVVAKTQLKVVHLLMYWIEKHFYDMVDQIDLLSGMYDLMMTAKTSLALWQLPLAQYFEQYHGCDAKPMEDGYLQQRDGSDVETNLKAALETGDKIGAGLDQLQTLLARKSLSPCYDLKAIQYDTQGSRSADELYRQLTNGKQQFSVMLQLATSKTSTFSLIRTPLDDTAASVVDRYSASTLLEQADRAVRQLFGSVTLQDWIQTTDMLEAQSNDLYAWLPARNSSNKESSGVNGSGSATSLSPSSSSSSLQQQQNKRPSLMASALSPVLDAPTAHYSDYHHLHADEIIISDIFIGIEGARRSMVSPLAFSADDLLLAFPSSIQYLYCMHYIIRSWVIHEVTASKIDLNTRVARIGTFLQMIGLSRQSCQNLDLFTELKEATSTPGGSNTTTYVPGFVENAVASALVSPEVRLFNKAWKLVGQKYKVSDLDTLAPFFRSMSRETATFSSASSPLLDSHLKDNVMLTPSIGWIFERIVEISLVIPDTYQGMIHLDKRHYMYRFLRVVMNAQLKLETQSPSHAIGMSFLISPNNKKRTWKMLKDEAYKEKSHHHHHHHRQVASASSKLKSSHSSSSIVSSTSSSTPHLSTKHGVFNKLVSAQMEKVKRDIKERERIDREWKEVQQKWQKRQADQVRSKHGRKPGQQHRRHASSSSIITSTSPPSSDQLNVTTTSSFSGNLPHGIKWPSLLRTLRPPSMASFHMIDGHYHSDATGIKKMPAIITTNDGSDTSKAAMVINLIHATTSIASGYEKRAFVFRVVTEEGAQYLLQGANVEDMQNWMEEINQAARHGTAKRRSVFAAESKEGAIITSPTESAASTDRTRRQKKTTVTSRTRTTVYGVSLEVLKDREHKDIPPLVTICIDEIEKRGLEEVGIYRVAGTGSVVQQLRKEFNSGSGIVNVDEHHYPDINVVADALKQFLRELPEPLLTFVLYEEFIKASASEDHDDRVYKIKQAIKKLPITNYQLLKRLIEHFVVVSDYEAINHMYATNLAIVFGPTLLQPTPGPAAFTTSMSNLGHHQNVVKYLILHYHYLFDIDGGE